MNKEEQEINWNDYIGKVINVKDIKELQFCPKKLIGYYPTYDNPFLVEGISGRIVVAYEQAEVIPDEREIDWNKVPKGTSVKCSNNSSRENLKNREPLHFLCYSDSIYWAYLEENIAVGIYKAYGYTYCILDEPCKEEWYKEPTIKEEIETNWKQYEGKKIEVSDEGTTWWPRELIIYNPEKIKPFLCKTITRDDDRAWRYARQIQEENPICIMQ